MQIENLLQGFKECYTLKMVLLGISGRTQPSTFLEGTLMTLSAAQSPFFKKPSKHLNNDSYCAHRVTKKRSLFTAVL